MRVIEYLLGDSDEATYRLLSTMLDPKTASATELAALYKERWEFETAMDKLKSHQRSPPLGAALQDARRRAPGGLRLPMCALRHSMAHAFGRSHR